MLMCLGKCHICVCVGGDQKRVSYPLKPELTSSCEPSDMELGPERAQVLWMGSKGSLPWAIHPAHKNISFFPGFYDHIHDKLQFKKEGVYLVYDLKAQPIRVCNMKLWVDRSTTYLLRGSVGGQGEASGEQGL